MKIYNNNMAFGDGGPFDFDGSDFDAACKQFADEMMPCIEGWVDEEMADPDFEAVGYIEDVRGKMITAMRAEFISGLVEVK